MEFRKALCCKDEFNKIDSRLMELPNFELKINLNFSSSFIPLSKFLTPSDKMLLRKRNDSIRFDFNIVKFKGLTTKKRPTSLLFNPLNIDPSIATGGNKLYVLKHKTKEFSRPLKKISENEKVLIMNDIFSKPTIRNKYELCSIDDRHSGSSKITQINGYACRK